MHSRRNVAELRGTCFDTAATLERNATFGFTSVHSITWKGCLQGEDINARKSIQAASSCNEITLRNPTSVKEVEGSNHRIQNAI
ncbi:hypothetical protein PR048_028607 [Dryococelus australis]|uniref:Uncharacterized protein n=1 Tax=Dryococelus australis TaxID=614101 RepID=A0ABQ9GB24_9NEOP|nr:hypothetical protein PR048_028607 [Dryococelus australis]